MSSPINNNNTITRPITTTTKPPLLGNFLTYENSTSGIRIQYPSNWLKLEGGPGHGVGFLLPSANASATYSATLLITVADLHSVQGNPLSVLVSSLINSTKLIVKNFHLLNSGPITISNNPAYVLLYTFTDPKSGLTTKVMGVITATGNKAYLIGYYAKAENFAHYLPIVQEMVNSFQVVANNEKKSLSHPSATVAVAGNTFSMSQTQKVLWTPYYNSTYRVKIEYPSNWERHNLNQEIIFFPPFENSTAILAQLSLGFTPYENRPVDRFVSDNINIDKKVLQGFNLVDFSAANLKGIPAYKVVYTYTNGQDHVETMEIFSVVGNTGYMIKYVSILENYPKNFQTAQKMIDSLEIYKESNFDIPGLTVGTHPLGLTVNPDTNMLYVVNRDSRSVSAIDASSDRLLANVSVGTLPVAVTVNPTTKMVYVLDASSGAVSVIYSITLIR